MSVFNRFSDVINANINSILDQAEDPRKMVRLVTQEMQATLVEVRAASVRYIADKKEIAERLAFSERESVNWQNKAELAVTKGRDDLAKAALQEKARHDNVAAVLKVEVAQVQDAIGKLKTDADQLKDKLSHARTREKALILRGQTARSRLKVKRQLHDVNCEDALSRFESYERKLDDMEGAIESYDLSNRTLSQEISDLQGDEHLTKELQELKARIRQTSSVQSPVTA
jgi:phage shock protein A